MAKRPVRPPRQWCFGDVSVRDIGNPNDQCGRACRIDRRIRHHDLEQDVHHGSQAGTFTGGNASGLGFNTGIVLTTGSTACVPGPNNATDCTGPGTFTRLSIDFTTDTGNVSFKYVFGSEEYDEFTDSAFNDQFRLLLDGVNIAQLPASAGIVEINNVNFHTNVACYGDNRLGDEDDEDGTVGRSICSTTA